jgi:TP901 family phage tail tape measure protein
MSAAVNRVRARFSAMAGTMKTAGRVAKLALAGLGIAAAVVGAKFEQSMANVGAILGRTREQMGLFIATARELGATTVFSASQAADAMYSLASAGQTAQQILASAPAVLLFAGAAATTLGDAAETLVQTLAQFNLQAEESTRVVNVFAAAISGSLLNAERLREGMSQVGSTASAVGLQLEQTIAILGHLNTAGMVGGIAGTRLKNVLVRLAAPNTVLRDLLGDLADEQGKFNEKMKALKDADPGKIFQAFGRIAAPAVLVLRRSVKEFEELEKQITGTNKAQEMFDIQMNTVQSQFRIFKSQLQENMIAAFYALRDAGMDVFAGLTKALADIKGPLVATITVTVRWIRENWNAIKTLGKMAGAVLAAWAAFNLLTNPIAWVAAAIVALTVAWTKWGDQISETVVGVTNRFVDFAMTFIESHREAFDTGLAVVKGFVNATIGTIVFLGMTFWDLASTITSAIGKALTWVSEKIRGLIDFAGPLLKKLGIVFKGTFEGITEDLKNQQEEEKGLWSEANQWLVDNAEKAYGTDYVGAVTSGMTAAVDVVKTKLGEMKKTFQAASSEATKSVLPTKEETMMFNVGLAVAGHKPVLTPEQQLAEKQRAAQVEIKIETDTAAKVEQVRKASLIRIAGTAEMHTKESLNARLALIESDYEQQLVDANDNEEKKAQIRLDWEAAVAQAKIDHQNAVLENFYATHEIELALLDQMGAAYDSFFSTVLDKEMTGKKRREKVWKDTMRSFVKTFSGMLKWYVSEYIKGLMITSAAKDAHAKKERLSDAKAGAVKAYHAFASIPIVGPALGAAAAAAAFAFLMAFQKGGQVPGLGVGRDTVPAVLEPREFVVRREAAERVGLSNLEYINQTGNLPGGGAGAGDIFINLEVGGGTATEELDELTEFLEEEVVPRLEDIRNRRRGASF